MADMSGIKHKSGIKQIDRLLNFTVLADRGFGKVELYEC